MKICIIGKNSYIGNHIDEWLSLRVFVFLHRTLSHQVCGIIEQGHMGVCSGLSKHGDLLSNICKLIIINELFKNILL